MLIDGAQVAILFRAIHNVRQTLNAYCLAPDKVPVSLDDLKYAIEQEYNVKISYRLVPVQSPLIRGMIEVYEAHSIIYVDSGLPKAWTRYVVVKEMSHHLVNEAGYWTSDPPAIIEHIVQDGQIGPDEPAPKDVATEFLTKVAVVEFLFPFPLRRAAKRRISEGNDTLVTTAEWLEMPEHLVEYALADWYMNYAGAIWEDLAKERN